MSGMRTILRSLALLLCLAASAAHAQLPQTLPTNTVVGRLGIGSGPGQAIPFSTLSSRLLSGSPLIATTDIYFGSGRPWCDIMSKGATVNGTADDDTAAIQACIDQVEALGAGTVYVPPGGFCIKSGPVIMHNTGTQLVGGATYGSTLDACGANSAMVKMDNVRQRLANMTVHGSQSFSANRINIELTSNCGQCIVENVVAYEGSTVYDSSGADSLARNVTFLQAYGTNMVAARQVQWFERAQLDHNYPANGTPPISSPGAWAGTTVYATGDIVSDAGYYLQATVGGTSGGTLPALAPYNTNIIDGTVTWQLLGPTAYCNINVINAPEVHMHHSDVTGYASSGICVTGSSSFFKFTDGVFASALFSSVDLSGTGNGLFISNVDSGGCIVVGCSTIRVGSTFAGNTQINNLRIFGVAGFGIRYQGGVNHLLENSIISSPTDAVHVDANVTDFSLVNNVLVGTTTGATVDAGTSNRYTIAHNRTSGSGTAVSDGGTGTTKMVIDNGVAVPGFSVLGVTGSAAGPYAPITATLNNSVLRVNNLGTSLGFGALNLSGTNAVANQLPVGNGGTGLSSGTSGGVPYFSAASTMASSGALTANGVVLGGGAGAAPTSTAAGTTGKVLTGVTGSAPTYQSIRQIVSGANTGTIAAGATSYLLTGIGAPQATTVAAPTSPLDGTFTRMYLNVQTAPGAAQTYTATLYVGTYGSGTLSATSITCTISGAVATSCNDNAHTAAITAGQAYAIQVVASAGAAGTGTDGWSLELDNP